MPPAHAIAPLFGTIAVKTTSAPTVPAIGEAFGQVLRSVWGAASGGVAAPASADGVHGRPAPADPEPEAATISGAAADQAASPALPPDMPVAAPTAAVAGKQAHPAKDGRRAGAAGAMAHREADPKAVAPGPSVMPTVEAVTSSAGVSSQVTVPPAATRPLGVSPVQANHHQASPVQDAASAQAATTRQGTPSRGPSAAQVAAVAEAPDTGGTPPPGVVPNQATATANGLDPDGITSPDAVASRTAAPAKRPDLRGRPPQAASPAATPAPGAEPIAQTVPIEPSAHPAGAEPFHAVPDPSASPGRDSLAGQGGSEPGGNAPSLQPHEIPVPAGQPASTAAAPNMPSQSERAASLSPDQQAALSPPLPEAATGTTAAAASAPATDRKITLRPVGAADPAHPAAPSDASPEPVVPAGTAPAAPATASVAVTLQTHPASPAEQVAPALLTLGKTVGGGQQMTVRLQPADLGMVQVRIEQAASGTTQITITAENPATLLALQRDQPELHRTLDEAGIPAAGRIVTFHVAQASQAGTGSGAGHAGSPQDQASRNSNGSPGADTATAGGRGSYQARERNAYPTGRRPAAPPATAGPQVATAAQSYRIGLDITA